MVTFQKVISGIWGLLLGLWTTLKNNFFRKRVTIQYGFAPWWSKQQTRPIAARYRGQFVLIREPDTGELRCTACKLCSQSCPGKCIEVTGENRKVSSYSIDISKCLFCNLCVEACPFEALAMSKNPVTLRKRHEDLIFNLDILAQAVETPMPGVLPSSMGGDLRPGKKPFTPKSAAKGEG